ncbi:MAG: hypothetical protein ACTSPV_14330, partial [Candidatus Hodarchaeales archaeon]
MGIKHKATKVSQERGYASEWNDDHEIDSDVEFDQNEAKELVVDNSAGLPAGPVEGQLYFNTT